MGGIGLAISPLGPCPGCQLVQRRGDGVPLRVQVAPWRLPQRKQRIEIASRASIKVLGRGPGQRKVEEHQVQPVATANWTNANVVRLDVPMRDTLFFEIVDNIQEVFAEALQQIDVQPPFFTESLTKRLLSGATHQDTCAIADVEQVAVFDDMLMPQL